MATLRHWGVQRGATHLAYWEFLVQCNEAYKKFPNKLWYFFKYPWERKPLSVENYPSASERQTIIESLFYVLRVASLPVLSSPDSRLGL